MNELVTALERVHRHTPREESLFESVLGVLALGWACFLWYLVVWLLVG